MSRWPPLRRVVCQRALRSDGDGADDGDGGHDPSSPICHPGRVANRPS